MRVARQLSRLCLLGASSDSFREGWVTFVARTNNVEKQGNVAGLEAE